MAVKIPRDMTKVDSYLDDSEVQTRISKILYAFKIIDLHTLDWDVEFDNCGIDEYEQTSILTSIEHEFHTVFEDRVFENFRNFNEVKAFIASDHNCF